MHYLVFKDQSATPQFEEEPPQALPRFRRTSRSTDKHPFDAYPRGEGTTNLTAAMSTAIENDFSLPIVIRISTSKNEATSLSGPGAAIYTKTPLNDTVSTNN